MKRWQSFISLILLLALLVPTSANAQATPSGPILAYIKEGNVWLHYGDGVTPDLALTNDALSDAGSANYPPYYDPAYGTLSWSPNGKWLALIRYNDVSTLYVVDVTATPLVLEPVDSGLATAFPPAWRNDNTLTYVIDSGVYEEMSLNLQIFSYRPDDETHATVMLGTYRFGVGCGGGTSDPAGMLYGAETRSIAGDSLIFAWSGTLAIHSTDCSGSGVAAFDIDTQADGVISENLTRAAIDPSHGFLAGIIPPDAAGVSMIEVYNMLNLNAPMHQIIASDIPGTTAAHLAWTPDSTGLYYSLRQHEGDREYADQGVYISEYFSGLHYYNLLNNEDSNLYTAPAFVFTNIAPLGDNAVVFTQIDNASAWFDLKTSGASEANLMYNLPNTFIIKVSLDPADSALLVEGAGQVAVRPQPEA